MQSKYRAQETSQASGGEKSNAHKVNLQIVAFFYCEFIDYFRLGRSAFLVIIILIYKCLQYNLIYFYKKKSILNSFFERSLEAYKNSFVHGPQIYNPLSL